MALQIGQKRISDESSFGTIVSSSWSDQIKSNNFFAGYGQTDQFFYDSGIILNGSFSSSDVYYLTLKLPRQEEEITFNIQLQCDENKYQVTYPHQVLKKCVLNKKLEIENETEIGIYDYYDLIFVPNRNDYTVLVLCIDRIATDVINEPRQIVEGETTNIEYYLYSLHNLVNSSNQKYWKKLGVQARPGSLIVVNKEPIRIGRSGIYELNNGTKITNFMMASGVTEDSLNVDPFLVDYVYQKNNESESEG